MARYSARLTAGVGVLVAFVLLGGSATVAVADPDRSHSDRGSNSDRAHGHGNSNGNDNRRGGSDRGADHRRGDDQDRKRGEDDGYGSAERGSAESPEPGFVSGPIDHADVAELAPSLGAERRTADVAESAPSIIAGADESRSSEPAASVVGEFGAAGSSDRSGSDRDYVPKPPYSPPRLTLNEKHTSGIGQAESEPRRQVPVLQPAPAATPPASLPALAFRAPLPALVSPLPSAPVLTHQRGLTPEADWSDPLWGLTGLLLIPAAGAILGYRQARAAHAADRLRRS